MDNETLSFAYGGGNYYANFTYKSSVKTTKHLLYDAVLEGSGKLRGSKCVIRVVKNQVGRESNWESYLKTRELLQRAQSYFASHFQKTLFQVPDTTCAEIDRICFITNVFGRKLQSYETVIIDHYKKACPEERLLNLELDAISHYTYLESKQKTMLVKFQGFYYGKNHIVITGADTIPVNAKTFSKLHKCNKYCKALQNIPGANPQTIPTQAEANLNYHSIITARASVPDTQYRYNAANLMHSYSMEEETPYLYTRLEPSAPSYYEVFE